MAKLPNRLDMLSLKRFAYIFISGKLVVWSILQILSTIGVGLTALAVLILVCCRCAGIHSKCWFITALFILILGGRYLYYVCIVYMHIQFTVMQPIERTVHIGRV